MPTISTTVADLAHWRDQEGPSDEVVPSKTMAVHDTSDGHEVTLLEEGHLASDTDQSSCDNGENEIQHWPSSCCQSKRVKELYTSSDYWSLYIGLFTFAMATGATLSGVRLGRMKSVIPQPAAWDAQPLDSVSELYVIAGVPILGLALFFLYSISLVTRRIVTTYGQLATRFAGFACIYVLSVLSVFLGRQEWNSKNGLGYAVFAIIIGIIIGNLFTLPKFIEDVAKDGEFFIKCSLVLLAVQLDTLVSVGGPAILVAWIGSPIAVLAGFLIGRRIFKCTDSLSMLIAVGASWCGASAISAVAPIVQADPADVSLSISVVAFFALIFTFVQAYIAIWLDMPDDVAGAWIGASVDQTGNVIVSAAIVSEEATEIAGIVKMVLNAALGIMASVVACYWSSRKVNNQEGAPSPSGFTLVSLWDKFPKFTLGFVITSIALTIMTRNMEGTEEAIELPKAVSALNRWWFAIAFTGIGLTTNLKTLAVKAYSSGIIQVYLLANTIDIFLSLGLSYIVYNFL